MGLVFLLLALLWGLLTLLLRLDREPAPAPEERGSRRRRPLPRFRWTNRGVRAGTVAAIGVGGCSPITIAVLRKCARQSARDAKPLAGEHSLRQPLGLERGATSRSRTGTRQALSAARGAVSTRGVCSRAGPKGSLNAPVHAEVGGKPSSSTCRSSADRFKVHVGGEEYDVRLSSDADLAEALITPAMVPARPSHAVPPPPRAGSPRPAGTRRCARRCRRARPRARRRARSPHPCPARSSSVEVGHDVSSAGRPW